MKTTEKQGDLLQNLGPEVDVQYWQKKADDITRLADWEKLQDINTRFEREIKTQNRKYDRDFEQRYDMACRHIAGLRGEKFDKLQRRKTERAQHLTKFIQNSAMRDVEADHQRRLGVLRERYATELRDLVETARAREAGPNDPQKLLTDGRDNPDRPVFIRGR